MENNQNGAANQQQKSNASNEAQGGNGNRRHSHRGHRGGRHHHHKKENQSNQAAENSAAEKVNQPAEKSAQQDNRKKPQQDAQKKQNGNQNRRDHRGRGRNGSKGYFRQPPEQSSTEDDALSLADWRAKIVLKAADGSVPAEERPEEIEKTDPPQVTDVPVADDAEQTVTEASDEPMSPAPETPIPATSEAERIDVIGVRFRSSGKMYYFDPNGKKPQTGANVIVETARGPEFGEVCLECCSVNKKNVVLPLRPLIRIATPEDVVHNNNNRKQEIDALEICREKVAEHKLDMKLIDAQYSFDNSKLLFYFSAEGRVDFRELVKNLASIFHTRIELRQIGIRDEARMLGGLGVCGRTLCCSTFLPDFTQVSIKMAKEQNLSLNSSKISGVCGRLMCCLHYESEVYSEEIKKTPSNDTVVKTEDGIGTVISSNPLAGTIRVVLKDQPDTAPKQYHRDNVTVIGKERRNGKPAEKEAKDS